MCIKYNVAFNVIKAYDVITMEVCIKEFEIILSGGDKGFQNSVAESSCPPGFHHYHMLEVT